MGLFDNKKSTTRAEEVLKRREEVVNKAVEDFNKSLSEGPLEAMKKLGILEYLKVPDLDFYTGMAYHVAGEKYQSSAIESFERVTKESKYYRTAIAALTTVYGSAGMYEKLNLILNNNKGVISSLQEFDIRLECVKRSILKKSDLENYYDDFPLVETSLDTKEGQLSFYNICRSLSETLLICGECINQCYEYILKSGTDINNLEEDANLLLTISLYEKLISVLMLSSKIKMLRFSSDIESMAICALSNKSWPEKISIFSQSDYVRQIAQIIVNLCNPKMYPLLDQFVIVDNLMEQLIHIKPALLVNCLNEFWDIVVEASNKGINSANQYIGVAYGEIIHSGKDEFALKSRIEASFDADELGKVANDVGKRYKMSRKGHDALVNAEYAFQKTREGNYGIKDASGLSLLFFRVLEIEYNEKFINVFVKSVDIQKLKDSAFNNTYYDRKNKKDSPLIKCWDKDISSIEKIKSEPDLTMEIGIARTLLAHIVNRDDSCSRLLFDCAWNNLSPAGQQALLSSRMIDVIGSEKVDKFRNPGAHTGYVPYSVACECREYVNALISEMEGWFI